MLSGGGGKGGKEEKGVIEEMLVAALKRPHYFSTLRESMGARFRFLLFCFEFLHGNHASTAFVENKIRSGVYNAACQWFCWPPYWHSFAARVSFYISIFFSAPRNSPHPSSPGHC